MSDVEFPQNQLPRLSDGQNAYNATQIANSTKLLSKIIQSQTTIRAYVAGTPGSGHQASTANIVRRLFMPQTDDSSAPPGGFAFRGTLQAYCDGADSITKFMSMLSPELKPKSGESDTYKFFNGTVKVFDWAVVKPTEFVMLGFTGGADTDKKTGTVAYLDELKANYLLLIQPYKWQDTYQIRYKTDATTATQVVYLKEQGAVGAGTLVDRAFYQPTGAALDWGAYPDNAAVRYVKQLLEWIGRIDGNPIVQNIDLMAVYGIRTACQMGVPASDRIVEICGSVMASQSAPSNSAVILNVDKLPRVPQSPSYGLGGPNDISRHTVYGVLMGEKTSAETAHARDEDEDDEDWTKARTAYFKSVNGTGDRFDSLFPLLSDLTADLATLKSKLDWLQKANNRVLWVQLLADDAASLPQPVFYTVFELSTLPAVFEGQNTANYMLNVGHPYLHVAGFQLIGKDVTLYPTVLLGLDGASATPKKFQAAANQLRVPFNQWPVGLKNPAEELGAFITGLRQQANAYTTYLEAIKNFYNNAANDKFNLTAAYLMSFITATAPASSLRCGRGARTESNTVGVLMEAGSTLQGVYANFLAAQVPVRFDAQVDPNGQIFAYIQGMQSGYPNAPFTLSALLSVTRDPAEGEQIDYVTVVGETQLFGCANKVQAVFSAPQGPLQLKCTFIGAASWSPAGIPWMGFKDPYVGFDVFDLSRAVVGVVGGTLSGPDVILEAELPMANDQICFSAEFVEPPTIGGFFAMVGGINLVASLPPPLNIPAELALRQVRFAYNFQTGAVGPFVFDLGTATGWSGLALLPGLRLTSVDVSLTVGEAGNAASLSASLSSSFAIGSGADPGIVGISALVPEMVFNGQLTSGVIQLQDLLEMFLPDVTLTPPSTAVPTITQFSFACAQKTGNYSIACQLGFDWTIEVAGKPVITLESIGLQADHVSGLTTGSLFCRLVLLDLSLQLGARYVSKEEGWLFTGEQDSDDTVSLNELIATYLGAAWAVPDEPYEINGLSASSAPTIQTYTIAGKTASPWVVPFIPGLTISAAMDLSYAPPVSQPESPPVLSDSLSAIINWYSVELDLAWVSSPDGKETYTLDWGNLHAQVAQNAKGEWVATGSLQNETLGDMITRFVSFATGSAFGLTAPWNLLNTVPLGLFEVTFNFTTNQLGFSVNIGPINLGFATIQSIGVIYDPSQADRKVMITLEGSFGWTDGKSLPPWDATKPDTAPAPPGGGNQYIDLRMLALGQHIGLVNAPQMTTVAAAIKALRNLTPAGAPITGPNSQVAFDPSVAWLVGMDFGLMRVDDGPTYTIQLSAVFDDPLLYGLSLTLDGPAAKVLQGLAFEVLYRRITDSLGVYQGELTLPVAMRTIDIGAYTVTMPSFSLAVYTNGDFMADLGFPYNQDFSRSFTVQAIIPPGIPLLGAAGFYIGKLSSATTTLVPAATNGQFNPVIAFGFGMKVGFGKEVAYGMLSAGFELTVFGIIEGVIAKWCPNQAEASGANQLQLQSSYYFRLQGSFGIIGRLYGAVDFAVVKASVDIRIVVMAQITYESYQDIPISVLAAVDVRAKLKINLGLFSITLHFSFSMTIKETFVITNPQQPQEAPWQVSSPTLRLSGERRQRRLRARNAPPRALNASVLSWSNLLPAATPAGLTAWLAPAIAVSGEGASTPAQQKTACVALVALESVDPTAARQPGASDTAFELLAKQVLRWMVAAMQPAPLTAAQVDAAVIQDDDLLALTNYLADPNNPVPIPVAAIETFMQGQFVLNIGVTGSGEINATPFPMPPALSLTVPAYNGSTPLSYSFAAFNSTSSSYLNELRAYFDALAVIVAPKPPLLAATANDESGLSIGSFLFADQFRLIARQMIEFCRVALRDYTYALVPGQTSQDVVNWVARMSGLSAGAAFTGSELFAGNPAAPLTAGKSLAIAGVTLSAPAGATFTSVATGFGQGLTPAALANANSAATELLAAGATVSYPGQPNYTVQPRDSLDSIAAHFGVDLTDLYAKSPVLTQAGLIVALASLIVPPVSYTTQAGDTLTTVALRFGLTIEGLASSANLLVADLFSAAAGAGTLSLPHLSQLQVAALIQEVQATDRISQLAGMTGRYSLHGLRLPTDGVTPNQPCMCGNPLSSDCPMYALSGQQFAIPTLTETPFGFSLSKPSDLAWVAFAGGNTLTVTLGDLQAAQVKALQAFLAGTTYAFDPPGATVQAEAVYRDDLVSWSVGAPTGWASAGMIALPYGTPPAGQTALRLWPLPDALVDLYDATRGAPPRVAPVLSVYDEASGLTADEDPGAYGWAMQVGVTIKKRMVSGNEAGQCTYELVGVGESEITLLERFLAWSSGSSAGVLGFNLLYPGQPAAGASGLQSDDPAAVTWGIIQVNLSTVTNPPAALTAQAQLAEAPPGACFNTSYDFIKLLWECSITRSGGFYLYYCNGVSQAGVPDGAFNDKGEAVLSLVLRAAAAADAAEQNLLPGFLNTLVTGAPFGTGNASLGVRAAPLSTQVVATSSDTLGGIGVRTYTDPLALAEDNAESPLATGAKVGVRRGLYVVGPAGTQPGGAASAIATWFGTTVAGLQAANPQVVDWSQPLATGVALRLPELKLVVGTNAGGNSLASLGAYYGCGVDGLAADNQDAPGLFAGVTLSVRGGPTSRTPNTPPGSVTIAASRPAPGDLPAPTDPTFPSAFLETSFDLLGYGVRANAWFDVSAPGLPISSGDPPESAALAADRRRLALAADGAPLNYSRVVPVSRYGRPVPAGIGTTGPNLADSPYRGLGGIAQLDLYWLDSFGNRIIGSLGTTPSGTPAQSPALPLLYTDALLGLAQWSGVGAAYSVLGDPGSASLQLTLSFDTSSYSAPTPDWQKRAGQVLNLYNSLYYQLAAGLRATLATTLLTSGSVDFTSSQVAELEAWLYGAGGVYAFLSAQAAGGGGVPPPDQTLGFTLAPEALNPSELFEVLVSVSFTRPASLLASAFVDAAGVESASSAIAPAYLPDPPPGGSRTLNGFARAFETALSTPGQVKVKLAIGVDRREAVESTRPLWLTRLASAPGLPTGPGAGFEIVNPGAPMVYAPRPLFNTLKSAVDAPIYDYTTGKGINFTTPSRSLNFGAVDVDVWLGQMLGAVDTVLGPDLAASAALVDLRCGTGYLGRLLAAKESLAGSLSAFMVPVFEGEEPTSIAQEAAAEAFRQQMLQTLASFYSVSAAVQFAAQVAADMNEPGYVTPQLYGTLAPAAQGPISDPGVSLTTAKLALATTPASQPVDLTFLASSRNGRDPAGAMEKSATLNLEYRGLQIEHQIGQLPNLEGYLASTWAGFVLPPQPGDTTWPLAAKLGTFGIPLVVRAYPTPPTMVNQAVQQVESAGQATTSLEDAVLWNYSFVYSQGFHYPQDAVEFVSTFNVSTSNALMAAATGRDLVADLAEFVTVYPSVAKDLNSILASIDNSTVDPALLQTAGAALLSFVELVERVGEDFGGSSAKYAARLGASPGQAPYPFVIIESSVKIPVGQVQVEALLVELEGLPPAGISAPTVDIPGYTANRTATATGFSFTYQNSEGNYLTAEQGQAIAQRTVGLPGLNILAAQTALTSAAVQRNQNLVEGKVTAVPFVYQTSPVSFPTPLRPTLSVLEEINIATINSPNPVPRPLADQLALLFNSLFAQAPPGSQQAQLAISYSVSLNRVLDPVLLPVAFLPPLAFLPGSDQAGGTGGPISQAQLIQKICDAVNAWYATNLPQPGGTLTFDLKVMARESGTSGGAQTPLIELTRLVLPFLDWTDPPSA